MAQTLKFLFIGLCLLGWGQEDSWGHWSGDWKHRQLPQFHPPQHDDPSPEGNSAPSCTIRAFSDPTFCFNVTSALVSTDQRAPASETLPVPEVGEQRGAGETTRSGQPDQGHQAQMWLHVAEEHAHHCPLQVRPLHRHTDSHTGSGCLTTPMTAHVQSVRSQMFLTGLGLCRSSWVFRNFFLNRGTTLLNWHKYLLTIQSVTAVPQVFVFPCVPSATAPPVQGPSVPCGTFWTTLRKRRWWMFSRWSRLYGRRDRACAPVW